MINNLLNNVKVTRVLDAVADGQDASNGDIIDMQGFRGVMFVAALGDVDNGGVVTLEAQQNTLNSADGMATLEGSATFTAGADDADNGLLILDVVAPLERYIRPVLTSATANAVKDGVVAIQYGADHAPPAQSSTVLDSETILNAEEA